MLLFCRCYQPLVYMLGNALFSRLRGSCICMMLRMLVCLLLIYLQLLCISTLVNGHCPRLWYLKPTVSVADSASPITCNIRTSQMITLSNLSESDSLHAWSAISSHTHALMSRECTIEPHLCPVGMRTMRFSIMSAHKDGDRHDAFEKHLKVHARQSYLLQATKLVWLSHLLEQYCLLMSKSIIGYKHASTVVSQGSHAACRWLKATQISKCATQISKCQNIGPCALQLEFSIHELLRPQ